MSGIVKVEFHYQVDLEFDPVYDDGNGGEVVEPPSLSDLVDSEGNLTDYGKEYAYEQMGEGINDRSGGWFPRHTVTVEHFEDA